METRGKKSALVIIDMLNDFVLAGSPLEVLNTRKILPALKARLLSARREGTPVIYICDAHGRNDREFKLWPAHAVEGSKGAQVVDELKPLAGEKVVMKRTYSGFYRTGLSQVLRRLGVEDLTLTGCVTNICILYIAYEAVVRRYTVKVPRDSVAGLNEEDDACAFSQMERVLGVEVI